MNKYFVIPSIESYDYGNDVYLVFSLYVTPPNKRPYRIYQPKLQIISAGNNEFFVGPNYETFNIDELDIFYNQCLNWYDEEEPWLEFDNKILFVKENDKILFRFGDSSCYTLDFNLFQLSFITKSIKTLLDVVSNDTEMNEENPFVTEGFW